jgi:hypothetical protein
VPALLGLPLVLGGGKLLLRQVRGVAAARRYKVDRMRRVEQYRKGPLEERVEPFDSTAGARTEHRDERFESRKEPFLGGQAEEPVNDPDIELPKRSAVKSHKYY